MTEQERTLIAGCAKGEKAAWDAFVREYSGLIYHTIKKTLSLYQTEPNSDFVDDLFQEIFLSLVKDDYAQLRRFRGDGGCTLASWLRMIAVRRTIDQLRKQDKPETPIEESLSNVATEEPEGQETDDQLRLLARAIAMLQPRERIIIDLFFRQNLSAQDVAAILRMSVGAVYTHKSRILAKLRETLARSSRPFSFQ